MSTAYKFDDQSLAYFVSFATVNWIDVFTRGEYCQIIVDSIRFCQQQKGLLVYAWCIMPNHVHLIVGTNKVDLQAIMRDLKKFTSTSILKAIETHPGESRKAWMLWMFERAGQYNPNNYHYQFWQQDNHPIALHTSYLFEQKLEYLHQNPVKAGLVEVPEHWYWSSARNYANPTIVGPVDMVFYR